MCTECRAKQTHGAHSIERHIYITALHPPGEPVTVTPSILLNSLQVLHLFHWKGEEKMPYNGY